MDKIEITRREAIAGTAAIAAAVGTATVASVPASAQSKESVDA